MKNMYKIRFSSVFILVLSIISTSSNVLFKVSSVLYSLKYSNDVIQDVNYSLFSLIITTSKNTYKITNTPAIIAILGLVFSIAEIVIHNKLKQKNEVL